MPLSVEDYIAQLNSPIVDERRNAAWNLGRFRDPYIVSALLGVLNDADSGVRVRVVESLGNFREPAAVQALMSALTDEVVAVRSQALLALGKQGDSGVASKLFSYLEDPDETVRSAAAQTLGQFSDPQTIFALAEALLTETAPDVRYALIQALGQDTYNPDVVPTLLAVLEVKPPQEAENRQAFAQIFGQIGRHAVPALPLLEQWADDPDEFVSEMARWSIERIRKG